MYGMLKEAAKVVQSGRQIGIQPDLFAAASWERPSCNPIRRLHVPHQSLARTPGQTRLDRQFNLSAWGAGCRTQPPGSYIDATHTCVPHPQTECVIGAAQLVGADLHFLPPPALLLACWSSEGWLGWEGLSGKKELLCCSAPPAHSRAARSRLSIFQLSLSPQHQQQRYNVILPVGQRRINHPSSPCPLCSRNIQQFSRSGISSPAE